MCKFLGKIMDLRNNIQQNGRLFKKSLTKRAFFPFLFK